MSPVGGLRARLIYDNIYNTINDGLDDLDWFNPVRTHEDVEVVPKPIDKLTEILPNKVGISMESVVEEEIELGSTMADNNWLVFVDVMAEDANVGLHLATDVKDILLGRMESIGRDSPTIEVLDLRQATPTGLFTVTIKNFEMEKDKTNAPHRQFWWTLAFDVEDTYTGESG